MRNEPHRAGVVHRQDPESWTRIDAVRKLTTSYAAPGHLSIIEKSPRSGVLNLVLNAVRFLFREVLHRPRNEIYLPGPRQPQRLPEILSREEVGRILEAATDLRHKTLLMSTYAAGLRVRELCHLRLKDIDSDRMGIRVEQGKGAKDRYTLLSPHLLEQLRRYWCSCQPDDWLFVHRYGTDPLPMETVQKIFYRARGKAGIRKRGGIHSLRHGFATHLLEAGVDIHTIRSCWATAASTAPCATSTWPRSQTPGYPLAPGPARTSAAARRADTRILGRRLPGLSHGPYPLGERRHAPGAAGVYTPFSVAHLAQMFHACSRLRTAGQSGSEKAAGKGPRGARAVRGAGTQTAGIRERRGVHAAGLAGVDIRLCPRCPKGRMREVAQLPPVRGPPDAVARLPGRPL